MEFRKYDKIRRLGDPENDGILKGTVVVTEKLDGANASIWYDPGTNAIVYASRNSVMGSVDLCTGEISGDSFRGLGGWVQARRANTKLVSDLMEAGIRLYGEWLVKHEVEYKPEFMNRFYLVEIYGGCESSDPADIPSHADAMGIPHAPVLGILENPTVTELKELVGQSDMAVDTGEGIVIKNGTFVNKYGRQAHAKIVCEKFQEAKGAKVRKVRDYGDIDGIVTAVVEAFITEARISKLVGKIAEETGDDLSMNMTGRVLGQHWQDMWNEEAHAIIKVVGRNDFNFSRFKAIHNDVVRGIFINMMETSLGGPQ